MAPEKKRNIHCFKYLVKFKGQATATGSMHFKKPHTRSPAFCSPERCSYLTLLFMISFWTGLIGFIQYLVSISTNNGSKASMMYITLYKYYLQNNNFFFLKSCSPRNRNLSFINIPEGANKPTKAIPSSSVASVVVQIH